jgi:exodeoxyribonuclease VII large subunit
MTFQNAGDADSGGNIPDDTCTVATLNHEIERVLNEAHDQFPTHVIGEVAEVDHYNFGTFFTLRDLEEEPVISCLAWSSAVAEFDHEVEEGTKAVVEATVDFYPDRGDCQLLVFDYWPLGESDRQQQLAALRQQLAKEGLFDDDRKQSIPEHPACVGLVTSPTGSAREDVWAAISDRSPRTTVKLHDATVQGDGAVESLIDAIQSLDAKPTVETIIVTRGGGADADLWCFNAEPLVRCIAACSTPVVVAVGHEDDDTLVEEVADTRAMTPTEAGVAATTPVDVVQETLGNLERRINTAYQTVTADRIEQIERRIETAVERLRQHHRQRQSLQQHAVDLEQRIGTAYQTLIETKLDGIDGQIDDGIQDIELAAESEAASAQVARGRVADLESRIDVAYRTYVERELQTRERRITDAYRDLEAQARVEAGNAQARKLRVVVAILIAILLLGAVAVAVFLL